MIGELPPNEARAAPPPIRLERLGLGELTSDVFAGLQTLYASSYHGSHMYPDLLDDMDHQPEVFQLFLARQDDSTEEIVGAAVVELKRHDFIQYTGLKPVHLKRFSVLPDRRSQGVGKRLVDASKAYGFRELGLEAIFGESNELGALSMYGREGAFYFLEAIQTALRRNTPEQSVAFFKEFVTNPRLKELRYPVGNGIPFVFPRDEAEAQILRSCGYISKAELLAESSS